VVAGVRLAVRRSVGTVYRWAMIARACAAVMGRPLVLYGVWCSLRCRHAVIRVSSVAER
jgi:hypothetical protein